MANADTLSVPRCSIRTKDVIANDTDPEGDYPLQLVNVSGGTRGSAYVSSATSITYEASNSPGTDVLTYTVADSRGASSTGRLTVTIPSSGVCQ